MFVQLVEKSLFFCFCFLCWPASVFRSVRRVLSVEGCSSKICWCRRCRDSPSTLCCWTTSSNTPRVRNNNKHSVDLGTMAVTGIFEEPGFWFSLSWVIRPPLASARTGLLPGNTTGRQRGCPGNRTPSAPRSVPAQTGCCSSVQGGSRVQVHWFRRGFK